MTEERVGLLQLHGKDATIVGPDITVGMMAPEFAVQDTGWETVQGLASTTGKVRIILALPSLDTGVCDREARRFNEAAASLSEDVVVLAVSMDLPPALKRWCAATGVERVVTYSDAYDGNFGVSYGAMIKERRQLRRAVWVVDRGGKVVYSEYLPALGDEPNYEAVLAAASAAL